MTYEGGVGKATLPCDPAFLVTGAISSAGRAARLHRVGRRFDPVIAHQIPELNQVFTENRQIGPPCATTLCHQTVSQQSFYPVESDAKAPTACATGLCHQRAQSRASRLFGHRQASPSPKTTGRPSRNGSSRPSNMDGDREKNGRARPSRRQHGLIVRGQSFYVKWKVPKRLQPIVGKTHFVRSLRTGRWDDAVRMVLPLP